ncbi:unnamed protein product [Linum trigynum]|uniref:Uncharacterized protein n=1 Tax=Linum trigynum TaxID=586398 RepID=A0AAV2EQ80_9ROSI
MREALASLFDICLVAGRLLLTPLVLVFNTSARNQQSSWRGWTQDEITKAAAREIPKDRPDSALRSSTVGRGDSWDLRVRKEQQPVAKGRYNKRARPACDVAPMDWYKRCKKNPKRGWRFQLPSSADLEERIAPISVDLATLGMAPPAPPVDPKMNVQGTPIKS